MGESTVHEFKDTQAFNDFVDNNEFVVINFCATWSSQSSQMNMTFSLLSREHPKVNFVQLDIDEMDEISQLYSVSKVPTFKFLRSSELVDTYVGTHSDMLTEKVKLFSEDAKAVKEAETTKTAD
ncbi:Glutaredoxin 3 [Coemansia sp. D1744]|nr:Glutaredoxin 3 [Coemansia sp. D1744]